MPLVRSGEIVFEPEHKLRHLPFFEEIALREESDPAWCSATAGLVVLRLVDAWLESAPAIPADDFGARSVRAAIDAVDDGTPIKSLLWRVIDALKEQKPDIHVVVTPLMAYGRALEYDAKWHMAADVYHSVLAHLHPLEDSDASIAAHLRLGQCYRNLTMVPEAAEALRSAAEIAVGVGDLVGELRARVGEGRLAIMRGNLPTAERILDEAIRRASGAQLEDVRSRALHERSAVAQLRGQYELAIRLAYEALQTSEVPTERDRILSDLALNFLELGVYSAARDAYLVLSATAQEEYVRWAADLNLMDIAARTHAETLFELYRSRLVGEQLPPFLATAFEFHLGTGYQQFGNTARARVHLERAVAQAERHGLSQFLFDAEAALSTLETTTPLPQVKGVSLDVEEVATAIRELREAAGVS